MSEDTQEIKPCPFCRCSQFAVFYVERVDEAERTNGQIICHACGSCGPLKRCEEKAIKAWNEAKR